MVFTDWYLVTITALMDLWSGFLSFMPSLVGAIVVFVIGWFISVGVGKLITEILKRIKFNQMFEKGSWDEALAKADIKVDTSSFIGAVIKWILAIVFLMAAVEILGLNQFAGFLQSILNYLPNVVTAVLIFVVTVIVVDILEKVVRASVESMRVGYGHMVSVVVRWSVWVFALLAILMQLKVTPSLIQTLFTGLVALVVVAGGIAFGLGGKDVAGEGVRDLYKKLKG